MFLLKTQNNRDFNVNRQLFLETYINYAFIYDPKNDEISQEHQNCNALLFSNALSIKILHPKWYLQNASKIREQLTLPINQGGCKFKRVGGIIDAKNSSFLYEMTVNLETQNNKTSKFAQLFSFHVEVNPETRR